MNKLTKIIEYLFYLFLFLLPWQTRWIWHYGSLANVPNEYLTYSFYGTEIIFLGLLVLTMVFRWKKSDHESNVLNFKNLDFQILFLLFLIAAGLGLIWAPDKQAVLYYLVKFFEGIALVIFIINFRFSYFKAAGVLVLAGVLQSLLAIFQFLTQKVVANKWLGMAQQIASTAGTFVVESDKLRWLRSYGSLPHPNVLAAFLVISCLLLVVLLILARHNWEKVLLWLFLPILLTGLFFTFAKSAFVALVIGLLFLAIFIFLSPDKNAKMIFSQFLLVSLATLAILVLIYQEPVLTRLNGEARLEVYSWQQRLTFMDQAKELLKDNWLTGVGLGNYTVALAQKFQGPLPEQVNQPVHNVYILAAVELGVFGFLIFIIIILEALRRLYHFKIDQRYGLLAIFSKFSAKGGSASGGDFIDVYIEYKEKFYWFLGLTAVFFAILVLMVFDHYFWTLYFGIMLWWLCFGLWLKAVSLIK